MDAAIDKARQRNAKQNTFYDLPLSEQAKIMEESQDLVDECKRQREAKDQPQKGELEREMAELQNEIARLKEANDTQRRQRISNEIQQLIIDDKLPAPMKEKAIARAMADESYLDELRSLPPCLPGAEPVPANKNPLR